MGRRGLGRGLDALIAGSAMVEEGQTVRRIPIDRILPNPYQPRRLFDPVKMEELVASIREHGILQPVLLREVGPGRYQLVAGERRFRAAQAAGYETIPAILKEAGEQDMLEMAVIENLQREDIGPMEAARAYRRLIDEFKLTQEEVAVRVGKSRPSIANTIRLLQLPDEVQASVEKGEISEGHGRALLRISEEGDIVRAWKLLLGRQVSVRDAEKLADAIKGEVSGGRSDVKGATGECGPNENRTPPSDPHERALIDALRERLGTNVVITHQAQAKGKIEIEFYSEGDLERLADLLLGGGAAA